MFIFNDDLTKTKLELLADIFMIEKVFAPYAPDLLMLPSLENWN